MSKAYSYGAPGQLVWPTGSTHNYYIFFNTFTYIPEVVWPAGEVASAVASSPGTATVEAADAIEAC